MANSRNFPQCKGFAKFLVLTSIVAAALLPVHLQAQSAPIVHGSVYGGGRMANVEGNAKVEMKNGEVVESVYGGNDISGNTGNTGTAATNYGVLVTGGTVDKNVFGGANGYYGCHGEETSATIAYTSDFDDADGVDVISTTTNIPTISKTYVSVNGASVQIKGSVYGGGNLAPISNSGSNAGDVTVVINQGTIGIDANTANCGNVFAGGNMASIYASATANNPSLTVDNGTDGTMNLYIYGGVYGGNDKSGTISNSVANYTTSVTIAGAPNYIGDVFGGGNGDYTYYTDKTLYAAATETNKVFGCSTSKPDQDMGTTVTIATSGGYINRVFGGGNSATVGTPHVTISTTNDNAGTNGHNGNHVGQVFGGNNSVALAGVPEITLTQGQVDEVYGGGNAGAITVATGSQTISATTYSSLSTIINMTSTENVKVNTIYGGCNQADVAGGTLINLASATTEVGTIYGGCNISGDVSGSSNVLVSDGTVTESIFGGANGYYGCLGVNGYYGGDFDANDGVTVTTSIKMPTINATNVVISGGNIGTNTTKANVYGGGNLASVGQSGTNGVANLTVSGGTHYANFYGGGNMASVYGIDNLLISGGSITGDVFGGNDKTGSVTGAGRTGTSTAAAWTDATHLSTYTLTQSNAAAYVLLTGTPTITGSVFGGGNGDYTYYTDKSTYESATEANKVLVCSAEKPVQTSAFVDIHIDCAGTIGKVFAGGNNATVGATTDNSSPDIAATVYLNTTGNPLAVSTPCTTTNVGTIFGGNNKATMYQVPSIDLRQGKVGNVYGGGNMGGMNGNNQNLAAGGLALSTYVRIPSPNVLVSQNLYGGCKAADVVNQTYVELAQGKVEGMIFGANDIAGNVTTANVVIDGVSVVNKVFGGGNGEYCYVPVTPATNPETYTVTDAGETFTVAGRPTTATAKVDIKGAAKIYNNVYGGGLAGDCVNTIVNLDLTDQGASDADLGILYAMVFGGGCGDVDHIGVDPTATCISASCTGGKVWGTHVGNVTNLATLNINTIGKMVATNPESESHRNAIFGGGHAGDVKDVMLTLSSTCKAHIPAIYGGCMASDLTGTTTMIINGASTLPTGYTANVDTIYGGNDFSGLTNHTDLTINSGTFQHVFGAGNGDYDYKSWLEAKLFDMACADTVPYSMTVDITYNGGEFLGTVYGGGNLGLVGNRDLNPNHVTDADRGYITVNIHDGQFDRHVFAGARGSKSMNKKFFGRGVVGTDPLTPDGSTTVFAQHLAYATKQVNMDGGYIKFSLYGGSEAVDDGFFWECQGNDSVGSGCSKHYTTSTLRPSSILNVVGGEINKSLYGGGYQGNIYGSVYVNIGYRAVNASPVWTANKYGTWDDDANQLINTFDFTAHKPYLTDISGTPYGHVTKSSDLVASRIALGASVYNGSDWGEAGDNAYFYTRGFYGGESNILIDGKGYYTSTRADIASASYPGMNINYSIIGAGTSTEGGDVHRLITFRNYGDYQCPSPSKTLYSIQRADKVILDSVYVNLSGDQDAYSAYVSPSYSLCRIDTLIFRIDNVVVMQAPGIYIGRVVSKKAINSSCNLTDDLYAATELEPTTLACTGSGDAASCSTASFCDLLPTDRGTAYNPNETPILKAANTLVLSNGSYLKVSPFIDKKINSNNNDGADGLDDPNHVYGHVLGYMYLVAQDNTQAYVYAAEKTGSEGSYAGSGANDQGFVSTCKCENVSNSELSYTNKDGSAPLYRSWKVGTKQGSRTRRITLIANATPDNKLNFPLTQDASGVAETNPTANLTNNEGGTSTLNLPGNLAYATGSLELPPAAGGNFYIINSISIDRDNGGQITLVDNTYDHKVTQSTGSRAAYGLSNPATSISELDERPDVTFGLMFSSGQNFTADNDCWNGSSTLTSVPTDGSAIESRQLVNGSNQRYACWPKTVISGNNFISSQDGYISNAIAGNSDVGAIPTLDFVLTYSTKLTNTLTRDVVFTMYEFDQAGNYVGPIDVTVTIATVVKEIDDIEAPVLAMYNEGRSNEYVRKITIPATFRQKQLYIEGISWNEDTRVVNGYTDTTIVISDPQVVSTTDYPSTHAEYANYTVGETTSNSADVVSGNTSTVTTTITSVVQKDANTRTVTVSTYTTATTIATKNGANQDSSWFRLQNATTVPATERFFSVKVAPTESTTDNINNTLGWYHIEERELDIFDRANADYKSSTPNRDLDSTSLTNPFTSNKVNQYNHYSSYDTLADGNTDASDVTKMKSAADRIWVGTLDGRATASMDVKLGYNGLKYYQDQYSIPLAWVTLHMVAINSSANSDGTYTEQRFDIKVKIRTRDEGDTIYMAPDTTLFRTATTSEGHSALVQLTSFERQQIARLQKVHTTWTYQQCYDARLTGLNVDDDKRIKNNPARYVQTFKAALMTYVEGDVLDIMETITIDNGANPITVSGEDYSEIPIIRYSGSHCRFPGLGCAHYGPLIKVAGDGVLSMRNINFNGSGCTRVKAESTYRGGEGNYASVLDATYGDNGAIGYGKDYEVPDETNVCIHIGGVYFNQKPNSGDGSQTATSERVKTILYADAPIVVVTENGSANFAKNVTFTNNISKAQNPHVTASGTTSSTVYGGGAICLMAEAPDTTWTGSGDARTVSSIAVHTYSPQLTLGDMTYIYDNAVVDWSDNAMTVPEERYTGDAANAQVTTSRASDFGPHNYGAGIYVNGGTLELGTGAEDMLINIKRNYYLQAVPTIDGTTHKFDIAGAPFKIEEKTVPTRGGTTTFQYYTLDTTRNDNKSGKLALTNVYLTRTPGVAGTVSGACDAPTSSVCLDTRSDIAYFPNTFAEGSSVGITKWFPGYTPWDGLPRDTIAFARISTGKSDASIVDKVYDAGVFFNDSVYLHQTTGDVAFASTLPDVLYNEGSVSRTINSTNVLNKDKVWLFYHTTVNQYNIYFQRCATFGKGVTHDADHYCNIGNTALKLTKFKTVDSLYYRWDPQASCSGNTDSLFFRIGGGFFPYTYTWRDLTDSIADNTHNTHSTVMRERRTRGTAAISNNTVAENVTLRRKSELDSLTMVDMRLEPGTNSKTFTYRVSGSDLTGHCEVSQDITIKVIQQLDLKTYKDVDNFLGHGNTYVMASPGLDSSNFHDHSVTVDEVTTYYYPIYTMVEDDNTHPDNAGTRTSTALTRITSTDAKYLRAYKQYSIDPAISPASIAASPDVRAYRYALDNNGVQCTTEVDLSTNNVFCPGDVIELHPQIKSENSNKTNFIMWDFDATASENATFVVSSDASLNNPTAYYEPNTYWWQKVTSEPLSFVQNYTGDIYIYDNRGLAWLISIVNGYNGQAAQTLRFNNVYLKSELSSDPLQCKQAYRDSVNANNDIVGDYDMHYHKWTPIGNQNNNFEGHIIADDGVAIKNIIANESNIPLMGFFGYTDSARIENITLKDAFVKGNGYVGGLIGQATHKTVVTNARIVADSTGSTPPRTYVTGSVGATLVGSNCIGGLVSLADHATFDMCQAHNIKYMGNCIYVGGILGRSEGSVTISNNQATAIDQSRLSALYAGGLTGYTPASKRSLFGGRKNATLDTLFNNYVELISGDQSFRVGGLVGNAANMDMRNNYVYGVIKGKEQMGGLVAITGENVNIDHCFFVDGAAPQAVGLDMASAPMGEISTFHGAGNQVLLDSRVNGYNNLTRALNGWVKNQAAKDGVHDYLTWRSDLGGLNNGYPLFGTPDVVPVYDTLIQTVCSLFEWDGIELYESGLFSRHIVDSLDYLDSTATLILTVHYPDSTSLEDSVTMGQGYDGYGFSLSADEIRHLVTTQRGAFMITLTDTLQTVNGCDSVVTLTLYLSNGTVDIHEAEPLLREVKVYPNPTRGIVHIEGEELQSIEVYDATSRRILRKQVEGDATQIDLSAQSTGSYYIRVNTAAGSVVKKLIKK